MTERLVKRLIILSAGLVTSLIVANLSALKIWSAFGVPVDAGILIFPLSYITGDLLAEFYGEKTADFVALIAAFFGLLTLGVLNLAWLLPDYPGADNSGFDVLASMAGRIFLASIVSFLLGQISNNRLFELVRGKGKKSAAMIDLDPPQKITDKNFMVAFARRALVSSGAAHAVDAIIFEVIAFYGKLPIADFVVQISFAYIAGLTLELLIFPVTYLLAYKGHSTP